MEKPMPKNLNVKTIKQIRSVPVEYPFSLVFTGDTWYQPERGDDLFEQLFKQVGQLDPEPLFFAINGDFSGPGSLARHKEHIGALNNNIGDVPVLHLVGNHDLDIGIEQGLANFNSVYGPENYDFVYGNTHFIMLNTGQCHQAIPDGTLDYLESRLKASASPVKILMFHIPPYRHDHLQPNPYLWNFKLNEERFIQLTDQYNIDLVCCSHWVAYDLQPSYKGTSYIVSAGGGATLLSEPSIDGVEVGARQPPLWGNFHHFTKLSVHEDGKIAVQIHVVSKDKEKCGRDPEYDFQIVPNAKAANERLEDGLMPKNLNVKTIKYIKSVPLEYPISFLATGDVFTYWPDSDGLTEQLYKQVGQFQPAPAFFLVNGDFSHGKPEQYKYHFDILRKYVGGMPVLHTVGNHETDAGLTFGLEQFNAVLGPENYEFMYGNTHFIMLNTGSGLYQEMPDESIAFLKSKLAKSTSRVKVVSFHIPPFNNAHYQPLPIWTFKHNEEEFVSLMSQYNVDLVVCAHWTGYDKYKKDKTTYVTTAGGGAMLVPGAVPGEKTPNRGHFHHFTGFSIHEDGTIDVKVYDVDKDPAKQGHDKRFDAVIAPLSDQDQIE